MKETLEIIDIILKVIGGATAIILFIIGFRRYKKDQNWKRNEFVSSEMKAFFSNKMNRNAMIMLDWGTRPIELFPDNPDYPKRFAKVGREEVAEALTPHTFKQNFSESEIAIRDTFDHFLSEIERFEHFIEVGLVKPEEFEPYLRYWIKVIAFHLPTKMKCTLHHFINYYKYEGVQNFFQRFGNDIKPKSDFEECQKLIFETR